MEKSDIGYFDNNNVYTLFNLIKEIPGSNIFYKNTEGIILWHNNFTIRDLKLTQNDLRGKTVFDMFSPESAKLCLDGDLEVIRSKNQVCKQYSLQLITGETREYFTTKAPCIGVSGQISGIIVNSFNMKQTLCQQFKNCYANNKLKQNLDIDLQHIYFNFQQPLKEILLLTNLMLSSNVNEDVKLLCLELKNFAKILLSDCNDILMSKKIVNTDQVPITFQKINLRKLVQTIFNKQMITIKSKNTRLFLTVSDQIPEIIVGDLLRINKILQLIVKSLLESALEFNHIDINISCKIGLLRKINDKNIIITLLFEVENFLLRQLINKEQQIQNDLKLHDSNSDNFGLQLINKLIKELDGGMELIDNQATSKIVIHLPLEFVA